jgi:hypothetical protein
MTCSPIDNKKINYREIPMKNTILNVLLVILLITPSALLAQGKSNNAEKDKNENASVGTKELLARIEALEAIVHSLSGDSADVSGKVYHTYTMTNAIGAWNAPASGFMNNLGFLIRELNFEANGEGYWSVDFCNMQNLTSPPVGQPNIQPASPGCDLAVASIDFSWTQIGNMVEISIENGLNPNAPPQILIFSVSSNGNVVTTANSVNFSTPPSPFNEGVMISSGMLTVGVLVDN